MSELYFRVGETKGFTSIEISGKKQGYAIPIRELLQNSLDASREAENVECEINIYVKTIRKNQIPHIEEYEQVLEKAIKTAEDRGSYNANTKQQVNTIKQALKAKEFKVLLFSDNGIGMKPKQLKAILAGGVSIKDTEKSGGSFGVGNLTSYWLSSLQYVLYATKYRDDEGKKTLFTGSPILAGHEDQNAARSSRGQIVQQQPKNELKPEFEYPDEFPDFIKHRMDDLESGTIVAILGLSKEWGTAAEYAIASNFFHAIAHEQLTVKVHYDGEPKEISDSEVDQLISGNKDGRRRTGDDILSGKAVHQAWQAVKEAGTLKKIELSNADKVHVCIKSDHAADSVVILIRNGMVIARHDSMLSNHMDTLRKNTDFVPFTLVIDVDDDDAPKLFELVKGAENPYHNKLQAKRLDSTDEKLLKKLFEELSERVKEELQEIKRDSFDLPIFTVANREEAHASGNNKSSQPDKAKTSPSNPRPPKRRPPDPDPSEPNSRPPRSKPVVITRNMEAENSARYTDQGEKWQVRLRVTPKNQEDDTDNVYLSFCLAEDNDNEETKTYLDFNAIEVNGEKLDIPDSNKSQIKLGKLRKGKQYNILGEVGKPSEAGNSKVALIPILGLK